MVYKIIEFDYKDVNGEIVISNDPRNREFWDLVNDEVWSRDDFMPPDLFSGIFEFNEGSRPLNILKTSQLRWDGILADNSTLSTLRKLKLQDYITREVTIKGTEKGSYVFVNFKSDVSKYVKSVIYNREERGEVSKMFNVSYKEFLENEQNAPFPVQLRRRIKLLKLVVEESFVRDVVYCYSLFKTNILVEESNWIKMKELTGIYSENEIRIEIG